MRHLFLMTALVFATFVTASAQSPALDTKLSKTTVEPGETLTISADLTNLTPGQNQRVAFFVSVRQNPRPRPRPRRRRGPSLSLGHLIGAAPLMQSGQIYTASIQHQIPSRISQDITVNVTAVTVDRSGPRPALLVGDTEALMIDAP